MRAHATFGLILVAAAQSQAQSTAARTVELPAPNAIAGAEFTGQLVARVTHAKDVEVIGFGRTAVYTVATDDNGIQRGQRRPLPKF